MKKRKKSETRMTASVLKQDPNTSKVKKNATYFAKTRPADVRGNFPFIKLQNDT